MSGRAVHCGIIYADISKSSEVKSKKVRRAMLDHFNAFVEQNKESGGILRPKGTGDGIIIFSQNILAAAEMALRLRDHWNSFNWREWNVPAVHGLRVGLHYGLVEPTNAEGEGQDYIGSEIDTAARLEPLAVPGTVLCSAETVHELERLADEHVMAWVDLGERELPKAHGRRQVYELLWSVQASARIVQEPTAPVSSGSSGPGQPPCTMNGACIEVLTRMICWNQGQIISHLFLAGEKHKDLRKAPKGKPKVQAKMLADLQSFLTVRIQVALRQNFEFARQLFALRKGVGCEPRMAFKYHRIHPATNQLVICSYNVDDSARYRSLFESDIGSNTASLFVEENGKYYLENDIPSAALSGAYVNPRIDPDRLAVYRAPAQPIPFALGRVPAENWDQQWASCWRNHPTSGRTGQKPSPESCYKSTLVVPCTLRNNTLLDPSEFWSRLTGKAHKEALYWIHRDMDVLDVQRQIYAYFCMDYPEVGYFDRGFDVQVGYIVADILSLYFFINQMYTVYSETVRGIESRTE